MSDEEQFIKIIEQMTDLYKRKNADYGSSFTNLWKEFGEITLAVRLSDKLNRFKILITSPAQIKEETLEDTLQDLANYAIMGIIELRRGKNESI